MPIRTEKSHKANDCALDPILEITEYAFEQLPSLEAIITNNALKASKATKPSSRYEQPPNDQKHRPHQSQVEEHRKDYEALSRNNLNLSSQLKESMLEADKKDNEVHALLSELTTLRDQRHEVITELDLALDHIAALQDESTLSRVYRATFQTVKSYRFFLSTVLDTVVTKAGSLPNATFDFLPIEPQTRLAQIALAQRRRRTRATSSPSSSSGPPA